jgi:hypothetical protein
VSVEIINHFCKVATFLALATSAKPTITVDVAGVYVFSLQVNDGKLDSPVITTTVTASAANLAPVANAGTAQTDARGATVTLDDSGSTDANSDILIYTWTMTFRPTTSAATLGAGTNLVKPTLVADVAGIYVFTLMVNDGSLNSTVATVAVTATTP